MLVDFIQKLARGQPIMQPLPERGTAGAPRLQCSWASSRATRLAVQLSRHMGVISLLACAALF